MRDGFFTRLHGGHEQETVGRKEAKHKRKDKRKDKRKEEGKEGGDEGGLGNDRNERGEGIESGKKPRRGRIDEKTRKRREKGGTWKEKVARKKGRKEEKRNKEGRKNVARERVAPFQEHRGWSRVAVNDLEDGEGAIPLLLLAPLHWYCRLEGGTFGPKKKPGWRGAPPPLQRGKELELSNTILQHDRNPIPICFVSC